MGGLEASRRIRITAPQVRVVAVTAWSDEPGRRLLRNGVSACVGKNITRVELEALLRRVLQGKAPAIAAARRIQRRSDKSLRCTDRSKLPLLKSSLSMLVDNLRSYDSVAIVVYAGSAGLVLSPTPGTQKPPSKAKATSG